MSTTTYNKRSGIERGTGTIRKLPSGRYQVRIPKRDSGGAIVDYLSLGTFSTLERARHAAETTDPMAAALMAESVGGLVTAVIDYLSDPARPEAIEPRTEDGYRQLLRSGPLASMADAKVTDLATASVMWTWWNSNNHRPTARAKSWRLLAQAVRLAPTVGYASPILAEPVVSPGLEPDTLAAQLRRLPSADDVRAVAARLDETAPHLALFVRLGWLTGLRLGELLALTPARVDLNRRLVVVEATIEEVGGQQREKSPKSAAGNRDVPIGPEATRLLGDWLAAHPTPRDGYIIVGPAGRTPWRANISTAIRRAREAAGVTTPLTPHKLRHARLTALAGITVAGGRRGDQATLARVAGHAKVNTTIQHYVQASDDLARQLTDALDEASSAV